MVLDCCLIITFASIIKLLK